MAGLYSQKTYVCSIPINDLYSKVKNATIPEYDKMEYTWQLALLVYLEFDKRVNVNITCSSLVVKEVNDNKIDSAPPNLSDWII